MGLAERAVRLVARASTGAGAWRLPTATITRDTRGVPTISAADEPRLYHAAGFAQACDRLWQMDVLRRRAQGRLSEVLGEATVADDVRARRLALARVAAASESLLSPACRANLLAFSDGVNAAIRRYGLRLPPEFLLLRYRPAPWTPLDSVMIVKQLGFDLALNLKYEVFRASLDPALYDTLGVPRYPADGPVTVPTTAVPAPLVGSPVATLPAESRLWLSGLLNGERQAGSNAWALAGHRTASGAPLLANDPHVLFTHPSLWYQLGLETPGSSAYGVTVPGIPGLIAGGNTALAWGITNATVDTQDLCTDPPAPTWTEESTITVRGGTPVPVRAAGGDQHVEFGDGTGLFWSGCAPSSEIEACQQMWRSRSYGEFREVLRNFGVPVLNVVVADQDGTIALKTAGNVPRRERGTGLAPTTHEAVERSWTDFVEFDELPEVVNPPEGYVVSANHKLLADDAPLDVGQDWVAPYRAARIEELILSTARVTPEDCAAWQMDDLNGRARLLLPTLLAAIPATHPAHAVLSTWDCRDTPEAAAPLVFARLVQALGDEWLNPLLGEELAAQVPDHTQQLDNLILNRSARTALGIREPLTHTVEKVLSTLDLHVRYDEVHRIADHHPVGKAIPALRPVFCPPPTPVGGSRHTVCLMAPDRAGTVIEGAPWRLVAELTPDATHVWDALRHGSSGHPLSPHYDDQTAAHTAGRLHKTVLDQAAIGHPG